MTQHTGTIEFVSRKYDKYAVKLEGQDGWYSTKSQYADEWDYQPKKGDEVTFDDGGKKYFSKHKVLKMGAGNPVGGKAGGYKGNGGNMIGVEIGHASKLAMDMLIAKYGAEEYGSNGFYKEFAQETLKIHSLMGKIKAKASGESAPAPAPAAPAAEEAPVVLAQPTEEDDDPIF